MKHIRLKFRAIFFGVMLVNILFSQAIQADEIIATFSEDGLVSDTELSAQSGQGLLQNLTTSVADLKDNVINVGPGASLTNGDNVISGGAFANSSGIASVIQNSSNNVIIQDSTIVNVTFQ